MYVLNYICKYIINCFCPSFPNMFVEYMRFNGVWTASQLHPSHTGYCVHIFTATLS